MRFPVLYLLLAVAALQAQLTPAHPSITDTDRTKWFRDAKFGIFIHWGPYSVLGRHEWARHRFQIPQPDYDQYARAFNPVNFSADAWVSLATNAGAKYMVITSKHHDGFSIFRSKASNYDMEITPYPGDPLKALSQAAQRQGMRLGFYHSIMDWHHPDYLPKRSWEVKDPNKGGNLDKYLDFMKEQIRELLTGYGDVAVMWFDGEWEHSTQEMRSDEIYDFIRQTSPRTLINDRLYKRAPGNRADFGTPEQFVPATGYKDPSGKPSLWESCVTINADSWGYNKYETEFKTSRDLIRMLIEVVSKGGNLLLNVGPTPDGRIQDEFVTRLNAMGEWMKVNSDSIYGTTASPFARLPFFGRATVKRNLLYLHVFQWPADHRLRVPGLKNLVQSARLLSDPKQTLSTSRDGADLLVELPAAAPDEAASVVVLALDGEPTVDPYVIRPDERGVIRLGAEASEIESSLGQRAKKENALGHVFLTRWTRAEDIPSWNFTVPKTSRYKVELSYSAARGSAGTSYSVSLGKAALSATVADTGGDWVFKPFAIGQVRLDAGDQTLQVKAATKGNPAMSLEWVRLTPIP